MAAKPARPDTAMTAECGAGVVSLSRAGTSITSAQRKEMLAQLHRGDYLEPFTADIVAYIQNDAPNRNFVRLTPRGLQRLASTSKGAPFLRDHGQYQLEARGGTILDSRLADHSDGGKAVHQTLEFVEPWAQKGVLNGNISRFSVSWIRNNSDDPRCTICDAPMFSLDCRHYPGDVVAQKDGTEKIAEMLYSDVDGVETSAVNVPAVRGTGIESIRNALAAWRASPHERQETKIMKNVNALLGLAEDAAEPVVLEAVTKLQTEHRALVATHAETKQALAAAQEKLSTAEKTELAGRIDALVEKMKRDGKCLAAQDAAGKPIEGKVEKAVRQMAAQSYEAAKAFVDEMPRIVPNGARQAKKPAAPRIAAPTQLSAEEKAHCKKRGISEEGYLKARNSAQVAELEDDDSESEED